jgi:glutamine amidotransferase
MTTVIIDYGSGNLHSAQKAFEQAASAEGLATKILVTSDPDQVRKADRVVLPGVGAFADCRRGLDAVPGMIDAMTEIVFRASRPFLGICVGMQLLAERGLEYETSRGLGWIAGDTVRIEPKDPALKIPHMGWNNLTRKRVHPLLENIPESLHAYFVHSYHLKAANRTDIVATTDYGGELTALVARDTIAGTQFHPEKSQKLGLALIANFLRWTP